MNNRSKILGLHQVLFFSLLIGVQVVGLEGGSLTFAKIIDLSHAYDQKTIYWPTEPGFHLERVAFGVADGGYFYAANRFNTAEHGGTHIDAPIHFAEGRMSVDAIPLERLIGDGIVIDVSEPCRRDPDYLIGIDDLLAWEKRKGRTLDDVLVLLRTGYAKFWPDRKRYLGTEKLGPEAVAELHFPGLDPTAAKWLVRERSIKAIGLDTASIDRGQSQEFLSHRILFEDDIPAFENLTNLELLPDSGFTVVALPMKIAGGSGGPLRIVALVQ